MNTWCQRVAETQRMGKARDFERDAQTEGEEETEKGSVGGRESKAGGRKTL